MTAFMSGPESDAREDFKAAPHHEKATYQSGFDELQDFLASTEQEVGHIFSLTLCSPGR